MTPDVPLSQKAIVLLSGGLDSATVLAIAQEADFHVVALSFDYGQRHAVELDAARTIAAAANIERHLLARIDTGLFAGSALTDDIAVPKDRDEAAMTSEIPVTYVPARNTIFLSYALALAEAEGAGDIFIGVNALDYSGYPDCRPEYVAAFQAMANLATKAAVEGTLPVSLHTPLLELTKAGIIETGSRLGVDYGATFSCYDPPHSTAEPAARRHCGRCDSCQLRKKGFAEAGVADPTDYAD